MSEPISQDELIDIDALLEELRNLPPVGEAYEYFTQTVPEAASTTKDLDAIYSGFIGQFLMPDITTYITLYHWLASLVDLGRTVEHRKQVADILELASVVFESFVSISLKLERIRDPLGNYPTDSCVRGYLTGLINKCLAYPDSNDISPKLQRLKSMIEEREAAALTTLASETKWLLDLWGPDFNETWLSEDTSNAALDIVAQGLPPAPVSNDVSTLFPTPTKLTRSSSFVLDTKLQPVKRPLTASQSLNVLPTLDSRPTRALPKRGVPLSRTKSLSTILPPKAQRRVMTALGTVTEAED